MTSHPYPTYRDSGIEWLDEVPTHWRIMRLKNVGEAIIGLTYSPDDVVDEGFGTLVLRSSNVQRGRIELNDNVYVNCPIPEKMKAKRGDILICSRNGSRALIGKNAMIDDKSEGMSFGAFMTVFRSEINGYLRYIFDSYLFESQSSSFLSSTINQLTSGNLLGMAVPIPPLNEQAAIAAFLDRETAKIDALAEEQKRLIEFLKEKRQAVISHAVTRGLNPDAKMKDSGIEWLGEVPEHWSVAAIKHGYLMVTDGAHVSPETENGVFPFVSTKDVGEDGIDFDNCLLTSASSYETLVRNGCQPKIGDLLFSKDGTIGRTTIVREMRDFVVASSLIIIRPDPSKLSAGFLSYLCASTAISNQVASFVKGAGLPRLSIQNLMKLVGAIPPFEEQQIIEEILHTQTSKLTSLINAAETAVGLLNERRSALISAAVTGKIDVRQKPTISAARRQVRLMLGAEIVDRLSHRSTFGRVKLQKLVYLAETYANVNELEGYYLREAAGPLDREMIADMESLLKRDGRVAVHQSDGPGSQVRYNVQGRKGEFRGELDGILGVRRAEFDRLIDKVGDLDTKGAEAVATLFAVWNDTLIENQPATDDGIVSGVLTEWHPEKSQKFKPEELHSWLGWMRRNGIVPTGKGPRTTIGRLLF